MKSCAFALIIGLSMAWARLTHAPPWTSED